VISFSIFDPVGMGQETIDVQMLGKDKIQIMAQVHTAKKVSFTFKGNPRHQGLFDTYQEFYVITHPEDVAGISPELYKMLDGVDDDAKQIYSLLQVIDPRAAPEIRGRYLPQIWDDAVEFLERVRRPTGRTGRGKARAILDWREAVLSDSWGADLVKMSPAELLAGGFKIILRRDLPWNRNRVSGLR